MVATPSWIGYARSMSRPRVPSRAISPCQTWACTAISWGDGGSRAYGSFKRSGWRKRQSQYAENER